MWFYETWVENPRPDCLLGLCWTPTYQEFTKNTPAPKEMLWDPQLKQDNIQLCHATWSTGTNSQPLLTRKTSAETSCRGKILMTAAGKKQSNSGKHREGLLPLEWILLGDFRMLCTLHTNAFDIICISGVSMDNSFWIAIPWGYASCLRCFAETFTSASYRNLPIGRLPGCCRPSPGILPLMLESLI